MKVFKILIILFINLIVLLFITFLIIFGLTISKPNAPFNNQLYLSYNNFTPDNYLEDKLVDFIKTDDEKIDFSIKEANLNAYIANFLVKSIKTSNKKYNPDENENNFLLKKDINNKQFYLKTAYINFYEKSFYINLAIKIDNIPVIKSYNTTLKLGFNFNHIFENNQNILKLKLSKVYLGNLGLIKPLYTKLLDKLIIQTYKSKQDFKTKIEEKFKLKNQEKSNVIINPNDYSMTINLTNYIIDYSHNLIKDEKTKNLIKDSLLNSKEHNNLIKIYSNSKDKKIGVLINLEKYRFKEGKQLISNSIYQSKNDHEIKKIIGDQLLLLSLSNTKNENKTDLYYTIDEKQVNEIISSEFKKIDSKDNTKFDFKIAKKANFNFSITKPYLKFIKPDNNNHSKANFYISFDLTTDYQNKDNKKFIVYNEIETEPEIINYNSRPTVSFKLKNLNLVKSINNNIINKNPITDEQKNLIFKFLEQLDGFSVIYHNNNYYFILEKIQKELKDVVIPKQIHTNTNSLTVNMKVVDKKYEELVKNISKINQNKKELLEKIEKEFENENEEVKKAIENLKDDINNKQDIEKLNLVLEKNNLKEKFSKTTYKEIVKYTEKHLPENLNEITNLFNSYGIK